MLGELDVDPRGTFGRQANLLSLLMLKEAEKG